MSETIALVGLWSATEIPIRTLPLHWWPWQRDKIQPQRSTFTTFHLTQYPSEQLYPPRNIMKTSVIVALVAAATIFDCIHAANLRQKVDVSDGDSRDFSTDASDSATSDRFLEDSVDGSSFLTGGSDDDSSDDGFLKRILIEAEITTGGSSVVDGGDDDNKIPSSTDCSNDGSSDRLLVSELDTDSNGDSDNSDDGDSGDYLSGTVKPAPIDGSTDESDGFDKSSLGWW